MVAAAKMRKAQEVALRARPYAKSALALLSRILRYSKELENISSPLWESRDGKKIGLVVATSDRGLSGAFNSSVLRKAWNLSRELQEKGSEVEIVAVGKKGRDFFLKRGLKPVAEFYRFSDIVTLSDIAPLADWILNAYEKKEYDKILFCSTQFISALNQKAEIRQVLPLDREELIRTVENIVPKTGKYSELRRGEKNNRNEIPYILEPSAKEIVENLVRDLVKVEIVHLIFESNASEHSARMIAMKNATDNAQRLQETLILELNKARQSSITQELAEVTTAREALAGE